MKSTPPPHRSTATPRGSRPQGHPRNPRRFGFTLSEVLVAIGILALGTVAVASLFPTAAFLQKEAVKETLRQNHVRSADAILEGVGLENQTLLNFIRLIETNPGGYPAYQVRAGIADPAFDVFALSEVDLTTIDAMDNPDATAGSQPDMRMGSGLPVGTDFDDSYVYGDRDPDPDPDAVVQGFSIALRSLPTTTPPNLIDGYVNREVFWVPLVRAGLEASEFYPDWNVYAFILQPDSQLRASGEYAIGNYPTNATTNFDQNTIVCANPDAAAYFPKVFRVPATATGWSSANPNRFTPTENLFGYVKPGEKVLGDNGVIYRVSQIDPGSGTMILAEDTAYAPVNQRDLGAVWVAPAPGGIDQNSPLADIRLLSNTVVRTNDF